MRPSSRWLAWAVMGLILVEMTAALLLTTTRGDGPGSEATAMATVLFVLTTATVGTLIALRRPGHRIGWLLRLAACFFATGSVIITYVEVAVFARPALPVGPVLVVLGDWAFSLGFGISATFLLLLFPTGRLPSPRWRPVAWLSIAGIVLVLAGVLLGTGAFEGLPIGNPFALESSSPLLPILEDGGFYLLLVSILASAASLVIRYRRAVGEERQQLKWVALGVVVLGLGLLGTTLWGVVGGALSDDTGNFLTALSLTVVPISIGIAVLRFRLYDIDRIISRTVTYGAVTAILAGGYAGLVFLLRGLFPGQGSIAVAGSTLAVAALFNPLRRRTQMLVDQRFNRSQYDGARVIEEFAQRLRTEVDLDELGRDLRAAAVASMQPASVSLWLRG